MSRTRILFGVLALVAVSAQASHAQRRITGSVSAGLSKEPLAGATIQVIGSTTSTQTTDDGHFALQVPTEATNLRVRRIGYLAKTVPVGASVGELTITLDKDVLELETQVVTGTATSVARANAANAVAQVSAEQLRRAPSQTLDNALQGKIAGAVITSNSGAPGGGTQVQIRGVTSINGSSSPLYVVDGVIVSNQSFGNGLNSITQAGGGISSNQDQQVNRTADLNPADIESIEVLKGPSAGAIYGSKASNGVIVIRTKRGSGTRPQISLTQRVGTYQLQSERKLGVRCFSASEAEAINGGPLPAGWGGCNDFEKQFYTADGPSYETSLGVRGGASGGTNYFISGFAQRDNAIQKGTYYNKQSIAANIGQPIGSRLTVQANNGFFHTLTDRGISGNDNSPVASPGDVFSNTPSFVPLNSRVAGAYIRNPFLAEGTNPFQSAERVKQPQDVFRYIGSINAHYAAYTSTRQSFDITALGGLDAFSDHDKVISPSDVYFEAADGQPGTLVTGDATSQFANINITGVHRLTLSPFTATTSFGLRREYRNSDLVLNQGRTVPTGALNVGLASNQAITETRFRVKDQSVYVQEEVLAFKERLLLTAAINGERSSVNGDDQKYNAYPKFAASYRLPFMPSWIEEAKLRGAYGKAGNQPPFGWKYTSLPVGPYSGELGGLTSTTAGNPNIRPETSQETEGGVDVALFKGRVSVAATMFRDNITDLILAAPVALSSGFTTRFINGGSMFKTGTELELSATPVQTKRVTWTSQTTFANVNNRVTRLDQPCTNGAAPGFSTRFGVTWVCQGNSLTSLQYANGFDTTFTAAGAFASRARHLSIVESAPDFQMGFQNDITIGAFRLGGMLDWRKGGKVVNLTANFWDSSNFLADTAMTQARLRQFAAGYGVYVENATFLKLRELSVSYALPTHLTRSLLGSVARDVRLEVSGRNLYTWAPYTGYDPEVSNFGNQNIGRFQDVTPFPPSRSVFFAVSAGF